MIDSLEKFVEHAQESLVAFNEFATKHSFAGRTAADHICYKCGSTEVFENIRSLLEHESKYLYQSIISGRRIAYIKFKAPIPSTLGDIWFLELSDQKPDGSQVDGFDHVEVYPTTMSYDEMIAELEKTETVKHAVRPHHTTHDIDITPTFLFRCEPGPLIEKIQKEQME